MLINIKCKFLIIMLDIIVTFSLTVINFIFFNINYYVIIVTYVIVILALSYFFQKKILSFDFLRVVFVFLGFAISIIFIQNSI